VYVTKIPKTENGSLDIGCRESNRAIDETTDEEIFEGVLAARKAQNEGLINGRDYDAEDDAYDISRRTSFRLHQSSTGSLTPSTILFHASLSQSWLLLDDRCVWR
jgi:hypothetical protein